MEFYLLRHGLAAARETWKGANDSKRPLTDEGRRKLRRIGKVMRRLDLKVDLILSSPYARAKETAQIVAKPLEREKWLRLTPHLAVGGDPRELIHEIRGWREPVEAVLLVGHEPYLSSLAGVLTAGKAAPSLNLKKGGLLKLEVDSLEYGRCATLEWLLTPGLMLSML
jgi:phosphohistidine phosphatase